MEQRRAQEGRDPPTVPTRRLRPRASTGAPRISALAAGGVRRSSDGAHVGGVRPLRSLLLLLLDLRALGQRLEAASGDRTVMDEQVLVAVVRRDEPVALVVAEPLHGSSGHQWTSELMVLRAAEDAGQRLRTAHTLCVERAPNACRHARRKAGAGQRTSAPALCVAVSRGPARPVARCYGASHSRRIIGGRG